MSYQGKFETWTIQAKEDLSNLTPGSGALYKVVNMNTGLFANNGQGANGVLQYGAESGGHVTLGIDGVQKGVFATAITTPGMELTVTTSGYLTVASDATWVVGRNLTAVSCVGVHAFMADFKNPWRYNPVSGGRY